MKKAFFALVVLFVANFAFAGTTPVPCFTDKVSVNSVVYSPQANKTFIRIGLYEDDADQAFTENLIKTVTYVQNGQVSRNQVSATLDIYVNRFKGISKCDLIVNVSK